VRSQIGYDLPGWLRLSFTGFPVEVGGVASTMRLSLRKGARADLSSATSEGNPGFGLTCANPSAPVTVQRGSAMK
jgi:hypothetical protein